MDAPARGFQEGGTCEDLFASAAPYYARFRRPYPPPVVEYLVQAFALDGKGRLLDAGCGTGQVFQAMARHFEEVVAVDPNDEMLDYAKGTAAAHHLDNVNVLKMRAEDITRDLGVFRMAAFGASFHWTDRHTVGNLVYDQLLPGGALVVISPGGIHSGVSDWELVIQDLLEEWLGPERRAGQGVYRPGERHADAIRKTRFREAVTKDIYVPEQWSLEQIIGYLKSTSYASEAVLGERAAEFEDAVRRRLLQIDTTGLFQKEVEYTVISAVRRE